MLTSRKTLGLAVTQQALTAVELIPARTGHRLARSVELPLAAADLQDPAKLGAALRDLLHKGRFSSSRCAIGLDAAYLAAREKRLPNAANASLPDILRIAAEQDFASEGAGILVDYAPSPDTTQTGALLVAAPRGIVDALVAAGKAAGLAVSCVTSSALCLARATRPAPDGAERMVLSLSAGGAELVIQSGNRARLVRRLPPSAALAEGADPSIRRRYAGELESELRRPLAAGMAEGRPAPAELLIWNSTPLEGPVLAEIGERLGLPVHLCRLPADLAGLESSDAPSSAGLVPAAALALEAAAGTAPTLDFLHSRLAIPKEKRFGRVAMWSAGVAVALIAAGVFFYMDWRSSQQEIAGLKTTLAGMAPQVQQAKDLVEKASFARGWYDRRPKYLECLRELADAFPDQGIWATNIIVKEDLRAMLTGQASSETEVLYVLRRLQANPRLTEVKYLGTRPVQGASREVSFAINFTLSGAG